jgi:hypothetical protein
MRVAFEGRVSLSSLLRGQVCVCTMMSALCSHTCIAIGVVRTVRVARCLESASRVRRVRHDVDVIVMIVRALPTLSSSVRGCPISACASIASRARCRARSSSCCRTYSTIRQRDRDMHDRVRARARCHCICRVVIRGGAAAERRRDRDSRSQRATTPPHTLQADTGTCMFAHARLTCRLLRCHYLWRVRSVWRVSHSASAVRAWRCSHPTASARLACSS